MAPISAGAPTPAHSISSRYPLLVASCGRSLCIAGMPNRCPAIVLLALAFTQLSTLTGTFGGPQAVWTL